MEQNQDKDEFDNLLRHVHIGWPVFLAGLLLCIGIGSYQAYTVKKVYRLYVPIISHIPLPNHQVFLVRELENLWLKREGNPFFDFYLTRDFYDRDSVESYAGEIIEADKRAIEQSMSLLNREIGALEWTRDALQNQQQNQNEPGATPEWGLNPDQTHRLATLLDMKKMVEDENPVITIVTSPLFLPEQNHKEYIDWTHRPYMLEDRGPSRVVVMISALMIGVVVSASLAAVYVAVRRKIGSL